MNRNTAIRTLAAALLLALGAGAAGAAPPPVATPAQPTAPAAKPATLPAYEALDANRDGVVTLPEIDVYSRPLARQVNHCDQDASKTLTREEYARCERRPEDAAAVAHEPGMHHDTMAHKPGKHHQAMAHAPGTRHHTMAHAKKPKDADDKAGGMH